MRLKPFLFQLVDKHFGKSELLFRRGCGQISRDDHICDLPFFKEGDQGVGTFWGVIIFSVEEKVKICEPRFGKELT